MATLQKVLSEIRELQQEEIDLVGGAFCTESDYVLTFCSISVPIIVDGIPIGTISISVPDDYHTSTSTD